MVESYWKVKDGLFIGDRESANDRDLMEDNQVTRVVNCAGFSVPNLWGSLGVLYLTYDWVDKDDQVILDQDDVVINEVFGFIEEAFARAEGALIHSVNGQSRSCCLVAAYLMKKFRWGRQKSMEFLSSRRPDHKLKAGFVRQLSDFELRLAAQSDHLLSRDWDEAPSSQEEAMIRNTHFNSRRGPWDKDLESDKSRRRLLGRDLEGDDSWTPSRLMWLDNCTGSKVLLEKPAGVDRHNVDKCHMDEGRRVLRSVLKVGGPRLAGIAAGVDLGGSLSTTAPCSSGIMSAADRSTNGTCHSSPASAQTLAWQRRSPTPPRASRSTAVGKNLELKVFRFLLSFEPLALAVEWGVEDASDGVDSSERTLTRIEFSRDDLADVRAQALRVVAEHSFLSSRHLRSVEALLRRLASRSLPIYEVVHQRGATLCEELQQHAPAAAAALPQGALVLARERVRELDGWWIRVWSGQWLQATFAQAGSAGSEEVIAERCQPSTLEVRRWLQDATMSQHPLFVQNATAVAEQTGLKRQR